MQFNSLNISQNMRNNELYADKLRNTRNMQKCALFTFDIGIRDTQNMYKNIFTGF